jgi:putative NIF3 family GTP cyclohydrolase 1 type 2
MMDYSQPTIQHILVKVTATRSLLDDAIALQAGDLYMTSTFKQVTRDSAVAWTTEAIKTARAAALTTEDTDL